MKGSFFSVALRVGPSASQVVTSASVQEFCNAFQRLMTQMSPNDPKSDPPPAEPTLPATVNEVEPTLVDPVPEAPPGLEAAPKADAEADAKADAGADAGADAKADAEAETVPADLDGEELSEQDLKNMKEGALIWCLFVCESAQMTSCRSTRRERFL